MTTVPKKGNMFSVFEDDEEVTPQQKAPVQKKQEVKTAAKPQAAAPIKKQK